MSIIRLVFGKEVSDSNEFIRMGSEARAGLTMHFAELIRINNKTQKMFHHINAESQAQVAYLEEELNHLQSIIDDTFIMPIPQTEVSSCDADAVSAGKMRELRISDA